MSPNGTGALGAGPLPYVDGVVAALGQLNVAVPLIFAAGRAIVNVWKAHHPDDPEVTDAQLIAAMTATFERNVAWGEAEVARLRRLIDEVAGLTPGT